MSLTFTLHVAFSIVLSTVMYVLIAQEGLVFVTLTNNRMHFSFRNQFCLREGLRLTPGAKQTTKTT